MVLLVLFLCPVWDRVREFRVFAVFLSGVNVVVCGFLLSVFVRLLFMVWGVWFALPVVFVCFGVLVSGRVNVGFVLLGVFGLGVLSVLV